MKEIPIKCQGSRFLPWQELKAFQGNLKEMSKANAAKLRRSILKHGWVTPVFVWGNEILDGHGRLLVLGELLKEGYTIGPIPVADIQAETRKEAAKILLAINSHYQTVTDQGLYEFMSSMELKPEDLSDITLPDIDLDKFMAGYFEKDGKGEEEIVPDRDPNVHVLLSFHPGIWLGKREEILGICEKLKKAYNCTFKVEE